jgi:hypothetical protein
MLIETLYERLKKSEIFENFRTVNPDAFACAGFFIFNFKQDSVTYALDFRNDKQIFTFDFPTNSEAGITMKVDDLLPAPKPLDKISLDVQVDLEDLKPLAEKALAENNIKNKLEEMIAVLQNLDGQNVWNLTLMCEGFVIINAIIHSETAGILKFEKKNLLDFVKKK